MGNVILSIHMGDSSADFIAVATLQNSSLSGRFKHMKFSILGFLQSRKDRFGICQHRSNAVL